MSEHKYVGTKSGLMDQLTATFAEKNRALFIDCRSLVRTPIAMNISTMAVVVCNTNVKHDLATSAYNERRRECELAVELLRESKPEIRALRDLTIDDLDLVEKLPEAIGRRSRHVITENDRTLRATEALAAGDGELLGQLMKLSHASLRADYEVSSPELDVMVELAENQEGVAGARMMGGGFGGSTVNLVRRDALKAFCKRVSADYTIATGLTSSIYVVETDDGVREM